MNDELNPIREVGFHNALSRLFGHSSSWGVDPLPLVDEPLASVAVSEDKEKLIFTLADGRTATYRAEGDCCSRSWIEHLTVPPDVAGAVVETYQQQDMGELPERVDYDYIKVYQTSFGTPKGEIVVEYRNSSNGYYGGWLQGPEEAWALDKARSLRDAFRSSEEGKKK